MKTIITFFYALVILVLATGSSLAQEMRYDGPYEDDTFFPIGFSSDGKLFAYGWFEKTIAISNGSAISIVVQSLVTDKILYTTWKDWDEGNVGPEDSGWYPSNAKKAWEVIADDVNKKFAELDIWGGAGAGVLPFPLRDPELNVEIREFEGEPGYGVYAYSDQLGEKMISSSADDYNEDLSTIGFVWNPAGTRIGVIMHENTLSPYSDYWVIGCHVSSGFKKTGK